MLHIVNTMGKPKQNALCVDIKCANCGTLEARPMPNAKKQLCTSCTKLKKLENICFERHREDPNLPVEQHGREKTIYSPTRFPKSIEASDILKGRQVATSSSSASLDTEFEFPSPETGDSTSSMRSLISEKDYLSDREGDAIEARLLSTAVPEVTFEDAANSEEKRFDDSKEDYNGDNMTQDEPCLSGNNLSTPDKIEEGEQTIGRKCTTCGGSTPKPKKSSVVPQGLCAQCLLKSIERRQTLRPRPERPEIKEKSTRKGNSKRKTKMPRSLKIFVKAEYKSGKNFYIRRFPIAGRISYTSLQKGLANQFSIPDRFTLEYGDNEDDYVIISTDADVQEMYRVVSAHELSPLRIRITVDQA